MDIKWDKRACYKWETLLKCHAEFISASNKINGLWDPETSSG
jgi:hypothetical protein